MEESYEEIMRAFAEGVKGVTRNPHPAQARTYLVCGTVRSFREWRREHPEIPAEDIVTCIPCAARTRKDRELTGGDPLGLSSIRTVDLLQALYRVQNKAWRYE